MILVAGATGVLGMEVSRQLRAQGLPVRALVRPASNRAPKLAAIGAEPVAGDLREPRSLEAACRGAAAVVSTATAASRPGRGNTIERVDRDGQLALVEAARRAGVTRFVYVSASPGSARCPFLRYKQQVEAAVLASGMEWVVLRPTAFMDVWLSPMMGWDLSAGRARIFGGGRAPTSYIAARDVAAFAVLALSRPGAAGRVLPLGGPEALSPLEVVNICEEVTGRSFKVQRIPVGVLRLVAAVLRPFDTRLSSLLAMGVAAAEHGDVIEMTSLLRDFPVSLTSVRGYVRSALATRP